MKPEWYLFGMLVLAAVSFAATWATGKKSAGTIEGIVATKLEDQARRIDELKEDFGKDIENLKNVDDRQWVRIGEHSTEIAYLRGQNTKANGGAAGKL